MHTLDKLTSSRPSPSQIQKGRWSLASGLSLKSFEPPPHHIAALHNHIATCTLHPQLINYCLQKHYQESTYLHLHTTIYHTAACILPGSPACTLPYMHGVVHRVQGECYQRKVISSHVVWGHSRKLILLFYYLPNTNKT